MSFFFPLISRIQFLVCKLGCQQSVFDLGSQSRFWDQIIKNVSRYQRHRQLVINWNFTSVGKKKGIRGKRKRQKERKKKKDRYVAKEESSRKYGSYQRLSDDQKIPFKRREVM